MIGDPAQALVLADVDACGQTPRRVQPLRPLHVLQLLQPTKEPHGNPLNDNDDPDLTDSEADVRREGVSAGEDCRRSDLDDSVRR
jgi:hypothetical protein